MSVRLVDAAYSSYHRDIEFLTFLDVIVASDLPLSVLCSRWCHI